MTPEEYLKTALGGNMNISTLKPKAFAEIMADYAVHYHRLKLAYTPEVVKKNNLSHFVSGGLNFEGLTEMKVFADNTGLIIEIEDAEDTCSKHLNIEETKKLADFLNCR